MNAVVFLGPTISIGEAREALDAVYLPPVSQGDVYRATRRKPQAIGIVDGYFERAPAVWHKEILWAMTQGIHVFGSASMGALRAAELEIFGMEGVGKIFEAYRDGTLEDDDEVAVAHGPAEMGYRGQSEAMVNIRFTLERAMRAGVISAATRCSLERTAKDLFYPHRGYPLMLQRAANLLPSGELSAFEDWLPHGQVYQKREDALAMLRVMRDRLEAGLEPKRVRFPFEHTWYWEQAKIAAGPAHHDEGLDGDSLDFERILDEVRLEGWYTHAREGATARFLAVEEARRRGVRVSPAMLRETADAFRLEQGLLEPKDVRRWMEENGLSDDQAEQLMEEEALLRWTKSALALEIAARLPDHLRASGEYARVRARALDKQRVLDQQGLQDPSLEDVGLTKEELFGWFFQERLERPADLSHASFLRLAGYEDETAFRHALLREFCYCRARH